MALIGAGVSIDGNLDTNLDTDLYTVALQAGHVYDFWAGGSFTEGGGFLADTELELTEGGSPVATDGNSAEQNNATFVYQSSAGGDHTLRASEFTASGSGGDYALTFVDKSVEDDISDHTFAADGGEGGGGFTVAGQGTNMVLNGEDVLVGTIEREDDTDVVALTVNAGATYTISVRAADTGDGSLADTAIQILDADGNDITNQGTLDATGSNSVVTTLDPGVGNDDTIIFVRIGGNGNLGSYELQYDVTGGSASDDFDVPQAADPNSVYNLPLGELTGDVNQPLSHTIQGTLENAADATLGTGGDWYAINLVSGFEYLFQIKGGGVNGVASPEITLRDSAGSAIGGTTIAGLGTVTLDYTVVGASGLYYVDVHGDTPGDIGNYEVSARLLTTPTDPVHSVTDLQGAGDPGTITGSDDTDSLTGGADNDSIDGVLGNDTLLGGLGEDSIDGGDGSDTIDGGGDDDTIHDSDGADSAIGNTGDDTIFTERDQFTDTMHGNDGNDTIGGQQALHEAPGQANGLPDLLSGDANDDVIFGSNTGDSLLGGDGNDTLNGTEADGANSMDGGTGNDSILGTFGNDTVLGGDGNDTVDGGDGVNLLNGGIGNDTFNNVDTGDQVTAGAGIDQINALIGWTLDADEERLMLIGPATINGNGNGGANIIFGNAQNNVLSGLAGTDILNGGAGNDTLIGGAGKDLNTGSGGLDHIKFNALSDSSTTFATRDAINTFAHGDKIDLSAIDANTRIAGNQAFTFSSAQALTGASGLVIAHQVATNAFLVLADVNGDHVADFSLNVYTSPGFGTFQGFDFIL